MQLLIILRRYPFEHFVHNYDSFYGVSALDESHHGSEGSFGLVEKEVVEIVLKYCRIFIFRSIVST